MAKKIKIRKKVDGKVVPLEPLIPWGAPEPGPEPTEGYLALGSGEKVQNADPDGPCFNCKCPASSCGRLSKCPTRLV